MMKFLTLLLSFSFASHIIFGQVQFNGFDQEQCGLYTNSPYSYQNGIDCIDGAGYEVFKNNFIVWWKCPFMDACGVEEILATSDSTAFLVDICAWTSPHVYKTINSFDSVTYLGSGAPNYLGYYLVSPNSGYLITYWDSTLYIRRTSDIQWYYFTDEVMNNDTIFYDTIFGEPYCDIDTLSFSISYNGNPINYAIVFNAFPINIESQTISAELTIFPNPAGDFIRLKYENIPENSRMEILNNYGETTKSFTLDSDRQYYVGDLPKGLYLIRIKQMSKVKYKKLIVN